MSAQQEIVACNHLECEIINTVYDFRWGYWRVLEICAECGDYFNLTVGEPT